MDNKQFLNNIAQRLNLEPATVENLIKGFTDLLADQCRDLNRVALPGLGSFQGVKRDETVVRDLATGSRMLLPPAIEVEFTPAGRLKNSLQEGGLL